MSSLVVVAIPEEDDPVWKVSSEKVPHLTLLYLGDSNTVFDVDNMAQFLEHAASTSLTRFNLDVDRRGDLGEDQADVIFFTEGWDGKTIKQFRHYLLQNQAIKTAYDATTQFEDWTPHLTLGYPESPANPLPDDRRLYSVRFDRIALWMGDYEGPEFTLKTNSPEVSMSDTVDDILAHYGTKGMKWGVRKADKFFGTKTIPAKPKSSDAKKADQALAKAKSKGTKALSNDELKLLNERLRLEQQFSQMNPNTKSRGKKFIAQELRKVGGMAIAAAASKHLIKRVV